MNSRRLVIVLSVAILLPLLLGLGLHIAAQPEGQPQNHYPGQGTGCGFGEPGEHIDLHNSGLNCAEARATLYVLPNLKRPQKVGTGKNSWVCVYDPPAKLPVKIRCHRGNKYFSLIDTN